MGPNNVKKLSRLLWTILSQGHQNNLTLRENSIDAMYSIQTLRGHIIIQIYTHFLSFWAL